MCNVFTKQVDGSYLETQKLVAVDAKNSYYFGYRVAISNTSLVVGIDAHLSNGAAYVY